MRLIKKLILSLLVVIILGLLIPQHLQMPVQGANASSYHPQSFWYYPWGKSVTHKGVDIFAKKGTSVRAATWGIVLYCGPFGRGGNVVLTLGPKWRVHYYAHLNSIETSSFKLVTQSDIIGTVGDSGNAQGKPPHLHYSIATLIPYPWRIDDSPHGVWKMICLNPIDYLTKK